MNKISLHFLNLVHLISYQATRNRARTKTSVWMVQRHVSTQTAGTQTAIMCVIVSLVINLHPTLVGVNRNNSLEINQSYYPISCCFIERP
jgi:uncharacterized membrane protein